MPDLMPQPKRKYKPKNQQTTRYMLKGVYYFWMVLMYVGSAALVALLIMLFAGVHVIRWTEWIQ